MMLDNRQMLIKIPFFLMFSNCVHPSRTTGLDLASDEERSQAKVTMEASPSTSMDVLHTHHSQDSQSSDNTGGPETDSMEHKTTRQLFVETCSCR